MPTLVTGSGEVFTASRSPAFTACDASAVPPPSTAYVACWSVLTSPASIRAMIAPTVGRIAVETASHDESMRGILSATNSIA